MWRVDQVDLRGLDLPFVRFDGARVLVDQRALGIELLLGDGVLLDESFVALQIEPGIGEQRLVAPQIAFTCCSAAS